MLEGRNKREWIRLAVDMPAKYRIIDGPARYETARMVDVHHHGGCLQCPQHLRKGEKIRIVMEIPFSGQVNFTAESMWSIPDNADGTYRVGMKFIIDNPQAEENSHKLYHFCLLHHSEG